MIQKLNTKKWVKIINIGFFPHVCFSPPFNGAFSFAGSLSVFYLSQPAIKKTGRGSLPLDGAGASSLYSSYCKNRKEVMRQS